MKRLLLLLSLCLAGCDQDRSPASADIESPLRNTCQSGDLDPTFPKCPHERPVILGGI